MKYASIRKSKYTYTNKAGITKTEARWIVIDPKGGPEQSFHNKRHAEDERAKIDRDIDRGIHEAGSGKITFGELWKAFIAHSQHRHKLDDLAGNTLVNYHWAADHILPEFGQRQIGKITPDDVEAFVLKKRETLGRKSVENFLSYMVQAFKYAIRRKKWLVSNPALGIKVPGEEPDIYIPSFEDVELLIQILHGPRPGWCQTITWENQKIAFALRAFGGLRGGEIAALRWDTIDLAGTMLRIPKEAGTHSMEDGLKKPKSKAGERPIPISQYLYDALLEHAHATDMKGFVIKPQSVSRQSVSHPRFLRARQADPNDVNLSSQAISDMHRDLVVRANLTDGVRPNGKPKVKFTGHDLRHWNVSVLYALRVNPIAIARRVGHAKASFTVDNYGHVIEGTEDGLKDTVPPIWHRRLARAEPGRATMIEGIASEGGPLIIDGTATRLIETAIPENAYPWVPEALRLLEGGWRPSDVSRHLGQARTSINAAFHRLGLPTPDSIRVKVRDRMFGEMSAAGYTDKQIAQKMNCSPGTVFHWRLTKEAGVPNTRSEFKRLMKKGGVGSGKKLTDDQAHEVWDRLEAGEPFEAIAKRFSVSHGLIRNIKTGRNYRWVKQERGKNEGGQEPDKSLEINEKLTPSRVMDTENLRESQLKLL